MALDWSLIHEGFEIDRRFLLPRFYLRNRQGAPLIRCELIGGARGLWIAAVVLIGCLALSPRPNSWDLVGPWALLFGGLAIFAGFIAQTLYRGFAKGKLRLLSAATGDVLFEIKAESGGFGESQDHEEWFQVNFADGRALGRVRLEYDRFRNPPPPTFSLLPSFPGFLIDEGGFVLVMYSAGGRGSSAYFCRWHCTAYEVIGDHSIKLELGALLRFFVYRDEYGSILSL